MRIFTGAIVAVTLLAGPGAARPSLAQSTTVTQADIARLQDQVYDLSGEIARLRTSDRQLAERLEGDLDDLRDEVVYLRVKLRKEGSVPRAEYTEMRDRIDDLRYRARSGGDAARVTGTPKVGVAEAGRRSTSDAGRDEVRRQDRSVIPVGQELDVRLQDPLNSDRAQVEDRFLATTLVDLQVNGRVIVPAGSELRGVVSSVNPAGRINRKGSLTVSFDEMTIDGRSYPIRGTVTEALESEGVRGEAGRIGTGAGVGAIIGGILGGFKGALAGILIGGGGVVAATEGKDVNLPPGTVLRVRLDAPPDVR